VIGSCCHTRSTGPAQETRHSRVATNRDGNPVPSHSIPAVRGIGRLRRKDGNPLPQSFVISSVLDVSHSNATALALEPFARERGYRIGAHRKPPMLAGALSSGLLSYLHKWNDHANGVDNDRNHVRRSPAALRLHAGHEQGPARALTGRPSITTLNSVLIAPV
jgi:hypothetical protein